MPVVVHTVAALPSLLHVPTVALHLPTTATVFMLQSPPMPDIATLPMHVVPPGTSDSADPATPLNAAKTRRFKDCTYARQTYETIPAPHYTLTP